VPGPEDQNTLCVLTNNFKLSAKTIADITKSAGK
ncbi:unnamed protein product, partial [marine sediment metagenome]